MLDHLVKLRDEKVDCLIYDRNCSLCMQAKTRPKLKDIKTWAIDPFHGSKHKKTCKCSPKNKRAIKNRLKGLNGSIAESTFAWFRNYARSLNKMRPLRHRFLVLFLVKMHNEQVAKGQAKYLSKQRPGKRQKTSHPYGC